MKICVDHLCFAKKYMKNKRGVQTLLEKLIFSKFRLFSKILKFSICLPFLLYFHYRSKSTLPLLYSIQYDVNRSNRIQSYRKLKFESRKTTHFVHKSYSTNSTARYKIWV